MTGTASRGGFVTPFSGSGDLTIDNDTTFSGDLTVDGDFSFGDASTDSLTVTGTFSQTTNGTSNGHLVTGSGNLTAGNDLARFSSTGSISSTSNVVAIEQTTGAGAAGAYALYINATGTNVEALKVDAGTATFDEAVTIAGKLSLTAAGGAEAASGLLFGIGTSANPATTATASANFIEVRAQTTATSGDNRLLYLRYNINGTTGGECVRANTVLSAAGTTAHGAHISLSLAAGGSISGLGVGMRGQLLVPDSLTLGGTVFGTQSEIYMEGASSNLNGTHAIASFIAAGNATGVANVLNAMAFQGSTGSGKMILDTNSTGGAESNGSIRILVDEGSGYVVRYLRYWDSENS